MKDKKSVAYKKTAPVPQNMERELLGNYTRMCLPILNPGVRGEDHGLHDPDGGHGLHVPVSDHVLVSAGVLRNLLVSAAALCGII